ncbi:MAG TPA: alpha/beta fold hydrolase, partial [Micromonosporaceae bacterium]
MDLAVRAIFEAPTPAAMAALLAGGAGERDPFGALLPLRTRGDAPPLFCLPPIAGLSWRYAGLLRALDPQVPVYALQSRGLTGEQPMPTGIEEMVADFADLIRSVWPHGPYHLLGWSFGANLAHALAVELDRAGAQVGLLAALDGYPAEPGRRDRSDEHLMLTDMFVEYSARYDGDPVDPPGDDAALRAGIVDYLGRGHSELRHLDTGQRAHVLDVLLNNAHAVLSYEPPAYSGDMLLVVAGHSKQGWATPEIWKTYVDGQLAVHEVDCRHEDMMEPGPADEICAVLRKRLATPTGRVRR